MSLSPRKRCSAALAGLAAALLGLCVLAPVVQAAYPGKAGKIIFDRFDPGANQTDLFTINPDGTGAANLTNTPGLDEFSGTYNGDGNLIAFQGTGAGGLDDIFLMNSSGG